MKKQRRLPTELPTLSKREPQEFTETFIRNLTFDPYGPNQYTDARYEGLMIDVYSKELKTFRFRMRLKKRRRSEKLGSWGPRLTVKEARLRAHELRQKWEEEARNGFRRKAADIPTLE